MPQQRGLQPVQGLRLWQGLLQEPKPLIIQTVPEALPAGSAAGAPSSTSS